MSVTTPTASPTDTDTFRYLRGAAVGIAALRFGVAGLLLLPVVWRRGWALVRHGLWRLLLLISEAGAPYALVAAQGLRLAPAADAGALIHGVMPLFVSLLTASLQGERFGTARKVGLGLILLGLLVLVGASLVGGVAAGGYIRSAGHGLFLLAAFLWACFTVMMRCGGIPPI